ncbi:SusD/RagB family nutrient-binding outer membrane lipoprotein [Flammeovirga sp. SJP92]|uniref:SusD/RagB family nutrient-binding outer membrane lipoprotein n=1 Tax=Flammeovirga sp. SJP92 TaxID=1775430 RepID=UPI00078775EB|nr:SusD/RagB family nutrient-binding outer membrane lipoprotein [Flammeovirga sp. SJP92]KXX71350.1 hypothetical protein AVL50_07000 [Flammeovirga sp. SJP92]
MKKTILLSILVIAGLSSCTNKLVEEVNTTETSSERINTTFANSEIDKAQSQIYSNGHSSWRAQILLAGPLSGTNSTYLTYGSGFTTNDAISSALIDLLYSIITPSYASTRLELSNSNLSDADVKIAQLDVANVINQLLVTQLYGDIPYSATKKGFTAGIYYPEFDTQEEALELMIYDLTEARTVLDSIDDVQDAIRYNFGVNNKDGYIKLINSLFIKIGVLMSEANPVRGAEVFKMGYNHTGGYIKSWQDVPVIYHTEEGGPWGNSINGYGVVNQSRVGGFSGNFISPEALELMQANQDPRIFRLFSHLDYTWSSEAYTKYENYDNFDPFAIAGMNNNGNFKKVHYRGLRLASTSDGGRGLFYTENNKTIQHVEYWADQTMDFSVGQYIMPAAISPATFNGTSPTIVLGADEVMFLIAEASTIPEYGINNNDAFKQAIELAQSKYDAVGFGGADVETSLVDRYKLQTNSAYDHSANKIKYVDDAIARYNASANKREVVITEHWLSLIGDKSIEAFSLLNRTGYPSFMERTISEQNRFIDLPSYAQSPLESVDEAVIGTHRVEKHQGGVTNYVRPYRIEYSMWGQFSGPNKDNAIERQKAQFNSSSATHFIAVPQWISKK